MELIEIGNEILKKVELSKQYRSRIKKYANAKSISIAEYDKKLAVTMIQLKNGKSFELDGETITDPVNTILEKIARGICWQEKLKMDQSESEYQALLMCMKAVLGEMNGLQSIHRNLD